MAKLLMKRIKPMSTAALPYFIVSGIFEIWFEIMYTCIDMAMNGWPGEYGKNLPQPLSATALKKVTPVKRIGAVSPAARLTTRIIPVRIPESELGNTMVRMVCQRDAPRFQQASRKDLGTAPNASRVL